MTIEYLSEITIEGLKEPIKDRFLLSYCDNTKTKVSENANFVHLENIENAYKEHPNKFIEHSLKIINKSNVSILNYQFKQKSN